MALLNFKKRGGLGNSGAAQPVNPQVEAFLQGYSIEVMPRTAAEGRRFPRPAAGRHPAFISRTSKAPRSRTWSPLPSA